MQIIVPSAWATIVAAPFAGRLRKLCAYFFSKIASALRAVSSVEVRTALAVMANP